MAPIHHLFDSHEHCNPEWCPAKANKMSVQENIGAMKTSMVIEES